MFNNTNCRMDSGLPQAKCGYCKSASQDMKSCSKCHLTQYCSKQCQRQDWQRHKKWCEILQGNPAFQQEESQEDPEGGQRAEMSRDQTPHPGESPTYVQEVEVKGNPDQDCNGSSNSNSQTAGKKKRRKKKQGNGRVSPELSKCSWCSKTSAKALGCSRCKSRSYCSDVCQRKDWIGGHQKTCQSIEQISESLRLTKDDGRQGSTDPKSEDSDAKVCDWCQKYLYSPLRCTGCGKVKYCSEACQKKDWGRQHKKNCDRKLPKKTKEPREPENPDSEVLGDAKKTVNCEIDDVEIEDDQIDVCDWCQKYLDAPLKCSGCRKARYCSEECQKKDWTRQHKDNCDKTFLSKKDAKATKSAMPELDRVEEPPMSCNWCQKYVEDTLPCDGCSRVIYCSIECKNKDWLREHQKLCDGKENKNNARSRPSNDTVEDAEGSKDSCKCCKKRTRDAKKCARCKIVIYCSKSCQRQDWPRHKKDCITVDGVIKTKEYQKAEQEEEAEARRRDVHMSPLEAMARLIGMSGAPQQNAEPCMMWMNARGLAKAKFPGFKLIENFDDLPGEVMWMVPQTFNKVLLAYISSRHHHFARHAVYIRDGFRHETPVMFYLDHDNPLPYFSWSQVAPGNYICIRNAIFHNFMDGSVGIRVNEAADVRIIS